MKNWFLLSPSFEGLFSMSCSGLSRTSTNTRHLLTICTQKATRFDKGSCRSRCRGQAGNSLSCSALSRTSADTGHDLTICTQKAVFLRLRRDSLFCRFLFRNQKFPLLRSGNSAFAPAAQIDSFFKASPASGAALKDKGLKLKS